MTETMVRQLFQDVLDVSLPEFPRMPYSEAMQRYGSDKPDLRIPLELVDVDDLMQSVDFKVFSGPAKAEDGRVAALKVSGGAKLSRKEIDDYTKFVGIYGAKGLAWIKVNERAKGLDGLQSPIVKFMEGVIEELLDRVARRTATLSSSVPTRRGWSTRRWARCASSWARISTSIPPTGHRCGWSTSPCSKPTTTAAWLRCTTVHRAFLLAGSAQGLAGYGAVAGL